MQDRRLTSDWLRERLADPRPWEPQTFGDGHLFTPGKPLRAASVLVPIVDRGDALSVLFTRRTAHLNDHAGQISFPGGRAEPEDPTPHHTALREAEEEIGLAPDAVEILGTLSRYTTVTGYDVTPVIGIVRPPFDLKPDEFEVAEIFEVPLAHLLDDKIHQRTTMWMQGRRRVYFSMPYREYYIWGATAGMLMNLWRCLMLPRG